MTSAQKKEALRLVRTSSVCTIAPMKLLDSWMILLFAPLAGCATQDFLRNASSGMIGCPAEQIRIVNDETGLGNATWIAECNGRTYYCSGAGGHVACTEPANKPGAAPTPPPGGCQYDTQCKGDRVCKSGSCVDPK
jgi:hypothetical protein